MSLNIYIYIYYPLSDTNGSAVKMATPNWYKNKTVVKRDESPMPPGLWNLTHNMEGENGLPVDLEARRECRERDKKEKERRQTADVEQGAEKVGGPAHWMPPSTRDMTETLPLSAGEDDMGLPPIGRPCTQSWVRQ